MHKRQTEFQDDLTQIDEDENESSKNVYSNMKKLGNSQYFSNPSRLQKQKIPEFEPRPNDLNALVSNYQINSLGQKPPGSIQYQEQIQKSNNHQPSTRNNQQQQIKHQQNYNQQYFQNFNMQYGNLSKGSNSNNHKRHQVSIQAEENIIDNDCSSSEFDVSENEAIGPSHNINQSILNSYKNTYFNQKIKDFNERKARCHTLLPNQVQKYFRENKSTKSFIQQNPNRNTNEPDSPTNLKYSNSPNNIKYSNIQEFQEEDFSVNHRRNKSAIVCGNNPDETFDDYMKQNKNDYQNDEYAWKKQLFQNDIKRLQNQQDKFQNQIAQNLPQSVLDSNKFNLNFNNSQQKSQNQMKQENNFYNTNYIQNNSNNKIENKNQIFNTTTIIKEQHNIPIFSKNTSSNQLSKIIQNSPLQSQLSKANLISQSPAINSFFSVQMTNNKSQIISNSIHKQVKEESIQKQIVKSQQIQVKLQQQSVNIEEKKTAFQNQFNKQIQNIHFQHNIDDQYNQNKDINQKIFNTQIKQSDFYGQPENNNSQVQNKSYLNGNIHRQISNNTETNNASSKTINLNSQPFNKFQDSAHQDKDNLSIKYNNYNIQSNSQQEIAQDVQSRSSVSQKQGFEKQSSLKMHQLQNNFQNQQYLQTNDYQLQKLKRSSQNLSNDHDLLCFPENETIAGTINTIDIRVDTQTIKTAKQEDKKEQNRQIDCEIYDTLIRAIFDSNIDLIENCLKRIVNEERYHLINQIDDKGNTPLLLAVKLSYSNPNFYTIVKMLLKHDSDPRIRDKLDWSCFEEVAAQKDLQMAMLVFENLINFKKKSLLQLKREVDNMLSDVPDFYLEMKWEFESNLIPFVSKIAPSDTFKIWKYGRSVRCDSTFAGIQKYRAKRRAQSLIFNSLNLQNKNVNVNTDFNFLTIIHKEEKTFHFPLQELDLEEKKKIIQDLLSSSESIQGNLKIEKATITPNKSFFGSKTSQKIQGYMCDKYDLMLRYKYKIFKKTRVPFLKNYDKYMGTNTDLSPAKSLVSPHDASYFSYKRNESIQQSNSCQTSMKEIRINGIDNNNPFEIQITETNKNEVKKQTLGLYVSEEFPMKFKVFMPLLQFLSNGNQLLMNLYEVFKDPSVNDVIFKKGFPVKVQIPLSYSIYANITFSQYKPLNYLENENIASLFNIPKQILKFYSILQNKILLFYKTSESVFMNRKEKQNTMKKQRKRLMLANLYLS